MTLSTTLALALFLSFGLWWLVAPVSVIRFYNWFHGGLARQPKPTGVRLLGLLWLVVVVSVFMFGTRR